MISAVVVIVAIVWDTSSYTMVSTTANQCSNYDEGEVIKG